MTTLTKRNTEGVLLVSISEAKESKSKNGYSTVEFSFVVVDAPNQSDRGQTIKFQTFFLENQRGVDQRGINNLLDFIAAITGTPLDFGDSVEINDEVLSSLLQQTVTVRLETDTFTRSDGTKGNSLKMKEFWPAEDYPEVVNRVF